MSCPLGFGGSGEGRGELSPYHCVLCRGLLHNPQTIKGCRHVYCDFCIRRFRDCPVCGADIEGTTPDASLAESISALLIGHAKLAAKSASPAPPTGCPAVRQLGTPTAGPTAAASCPVGSAPRASPLGAAAAPLDLPSLLLQLALQSLAGGNPEAALARLDMCADALCSPSEAADQRKRADSAATAPAVPATIAAVVVTGSGAVARDSGNTDTDPVISRCLRAAPADPDTASRLGAVLGCKADCHRRLGDPDAAHRHYAASLACLAPWRGRNREADSALSVTHNRLGDLLLMGGRLAEARAQYEQALTIRRQAMLASAAGAGPVAGAEAGRHQQPLRQSDEERVQDIYDLATSLCKVTDVCLTILAEQHDSPAVQPQGEQEREEQVASEAAAGDGNGAEAAGTSGPPPQDAGPAELLAEARGWLLRPEVLPYARACGLKDAAAVGAGTEAGASPGDLGGGSATASGRSCAAAGPLTDIGTGAGPKMESGNVRSTDTAAAAAGVNAGAGQEGQTERLPPQLVQRFGRVWGAVQQLTQREHEVRVGTKQ